MSGLDYSPLAQDELVRLCSRSINTIDGLWFLAIEQKYGIDTALELDTEVWREATKINARRLLKAFAIKEDSPIRAAIRLMQVDPVQAIFKPEVVTLADNRAVFHCTDCPPQRARVKVGRGEFPCKPVGIAIYSSYAEVVDPRIKLSCLTCPPDAHPPEFWCEWQYEI